MEKEMKKILYLLPLLFILFACGAQPAPTEDVGAIVNATLTAFAENNPQAIVTQIAPPATTAAAASCTYAATLVSENPLDGQQFKPGEEFKKTWTFKNSGTCAWNASALMLAAVNAPGDTILSRGQTPDYRMDVYSNPQKTTVAAGETISVVLDMQAPDHGGTFIQNWQIINSANNQNIPLTYATGATGKYFYVQVVVPGASNAGIGGDQKPNVKIQQIEMQQGAQACTTNAEYIISAKITGLANTRVSFTASSDNNGTVEPGAGTTIMLDNSGGYDVNTGIRGPFSDPENVKIAITVFVDGQAVNHVDGFICQGGEYKPMVANILSPEPPIAGCSASWFFTFNALHLPLGSFCPEPVKNLEAVGQDFEGGRAYRYAPDPSYPADQRGTVYIIYNDGEWITFPDVWDASQPSSDPSLVVPGGRYQPVDSIGKVWRENGDVRNRLGWAYGPQTKFSGRFQTYLAQPGKPSGDTHFFFIDHGKWGKVLLLNSVDMGPNKWEIAGDY